MYIGTLGVGVLYVRPVFANDRDTIQYTTSSFTGTTPGAASSATAVVGVSGLAISSFPYSAGTISSTTGLGGSDKYRPRLVSLSVRVTYAGVITNRSGTLYQLVSTDGSDLSKFSLTDIIGSPDSIKYTANNFEHAQLVIHGKNRQHFDLQKPMKTGIQCLPVNDNDATASYWDYSSSSQNAFNAHGVLAITGFPGTNFNIDVVGHYEVGGIGPGCLLTSTTADEPALMNALNASHQIDAAQRARPDIPRAEHHENLQTSIATTGVADVSKGMEEYGKKLEKSGPMGQLEGQLLVGGGTLLGKEKGVLGRDMVSLFGKKKHR